MAPRPLLEVLWAWAANLAGRWPASPVDPLPPGRPQAGARGHGAERAESSEAGGSRPAAEEYPRVPRPPLALAPLQPTPVSTVRALIGYGPDSSVLIGAANCLSPLLRLLAPGYQGRWCGSESPSRAPVGVTVGPRRCRHLLGTGPRPSKGRGQVPGGILHRA